MENTGNKPSIAGEIALTLGKGIIAGLAGTAAISISQMIEMKISGREPNDAPAEAVNKVKCRSNGRRTPGSVCTGSTLDLRYLVGPSQGCIGFSWGKRRSGHADALGCPVGNRNDYAAGY